MAGIALSFRNYSLEKPRSVSEMIDFANALQLLGTDPRTATLGGIDHTVPFLIGEFWRALGIAVLFFFSN